MNNNLKWLPAEKGGKRVLTPADRAKLLRLQNGTERALELAQRAITNLRAESDALGVEYYNEVLFLLRSS